MGLTTPKRRPSKFKRKHARMMSDKGKSEITPIQGSRSIKNPLFGVARTITNGTFVYLIISTFIALILLFFAS